jgi:hypothetical protein
MKKLTLSGFAVAAAFVTVTAVPQNAQAAVIVLDFEGLNNQQQVGNFYAGQGITFSDNALALIDADAGGDGNFGGEPSPDTALFFLGGTAATMNVAQGFSDGFSFFYTAINQPGFINVYDGLNATGNILASLALPTTPFNGAPDPTGQFSPFVPIGVEFIGTALSVDFGGTINQIAFDDITIGSATPGNGDEVPIPTPALLPGLIGMGAAALRKRGEADGAVEA